MAVFLSSLEAPLDPFVAEVLRDSADAIACELAPAARQKDMGVPFSVRQVAVARDLRTLAENRGHAGRRRLLLHLEREALHQFAAAVSCRDDGGSVLVRLRDVHLCQPSDFEKLGRGLVDGTAAMLRRIAGGDWGASVPWVLPANAYNRCPALTRSITVGPDGNIYPCPAFYHAGEKFSVGKVADMAFAPEDPVTDGTCRLCGNPRCEGCRFLESYAVANKEAVCEVARAHDRAARGLMERAAASSYLFDGLRLLKSRTYRARIVESVEGLSAVAQVNDIERDDFIKALFDTSTCVAAGGQASEGVNGCAAIRARWAVPEHARPGSRRTAFYKAVSDVLGALDGFRPARKTAAPAAERMNSPTPGPAVEQQAETGALPAPRQLDIADLPEIRKLRNRSTGWLTLVQTISSDRDMGMRRDKELDIARQGLQEAWAQARAWFESTDSRYNWSAAREYRWEFDFESRMAFPRLKPAADSAAAGQQPVTVNKPAASHRHMIPETSEAEKVESHYLMTLGPADKETATRLAHRQANCDDAARILLNKVAQGQPCSEDLDDAVELLGGVVETFRDWLGAMGREHGWPRTTRGWNIGRDMETVTAAGRLAEPCVGAGDARAT